MAASLDDRGQVNRVTAKPQIYHTINYLANYFVRFLPTAMCLHCNKRLVSNLQEGKDDEGMIPERAFCGHWLHYKCFYEYVNTEPFKRNCPHEGCEETLASAEFPCDKVAVK